MHLALHRLRPAVAVLACAAVVACSAVPNDSDSRSLGDGLTDPIATNGPATTGPAGPGTSPGPGTGPGTPGPGGPGTGNGNPGPGTGPSADPTLAPGAPVPGSELGNGKGVTDKAVKIVFHLKTANCGDAQRSSEGVATDEYYERIRTYVGWFNKYVELPNGRKLQYEIVDDGGTDPACQDKARAAGLRIAKEIKAFAALGVSINLGADAPIVADTVTRNGTLHVGVNFNSRTALAERAPYAWNTYKDGETMFTELAWYMAKRVKGTKYRTDAGLEQDRVYGLLFFEGSEGKFLAGHTARLLNGYGMPVGDRVYYLSGDAGKASQQASTLANQMKTDGVNTLVVGVYGAPAVAHTTAFDGQAYHPDNMISDYGQYAIQAVFNPVFSQGQLARMSGVSIPCIVCERLELDATGATGEDSCPSCDQQDNGDAYIKAYKQGGGSADSPQVNAPAYDFWAQLSTLAIGIMGAGPVLNARTFEYGLSLTRTQRCPVWRFFGRDHPQLQRFSWGGGKFSGGGGFTTLYYVAKRNKFGTVGYWESYDNYLRYDSYAQLPPRPTYDTGARGGYQLIEHKKTGLSPDKPC